MAINYDKVFCWGVVYCGDFCDRWKGSFGDPTWERNGKDSGKIKISLSGYHAYRNIKWIVPGNDRLWMDLRINGTVITTGGKSAQYSDCSGGDSNTTSASGTAELIQTSSNPYGNLKFDIMQYWIGQSGNTNTFSLNSDTGEYAADYDLGNNFKILPPKNLTGSVTSVKATKITATCNLGSWSDNANIKGTPYTGDGGRDWNFRAQIIYNGTAVYEITKNTGETKNATFEFTDLEKLNLFPTGVPVTMRFTASNDYQQTISYDTTFTLHILGWVVTETGTKKIRYISETAERDKGGGTRYGSEFARRIP